MRLQDLLRDKNQLRFYSILFLFCITPIVFVQLYPNTFYREYPIESFVVFHNIAEMFSVIVSFSIFGVGYYSYSQSRNFQTFIFSIGFLAVGLIDFMHMLGYKGMPDFVTPNSGNKSTQFWLVSRLLTALTFIFAVYVKPNKSYGLVRRSLYIGIALLLAYFAYELVIFNSHLIPDTYIHGVGLTQFKRNAEFVIMILIAISIVLYIRSESIFSKKQRQYYLGAFIICFFSELVFAVYTSVFDTYNVLGHIYKIFAFQLIYKAVFVSAINEPYEKLIQSNELLSKEIKENEEYSRLIQKSLQEKENLIGEIFHRTKNSIELVRSLLMIQASGFPNDKNIQSIVEDTSIKIQTMSLVHDHLYQNKDLSEIQVSNYLFSLSEMVKSTFPPIGKVVEVELP
ncbi:MASE3 domain-containing protein [Leptospira jelokensis]|uniref:MASE3 domain-containing protein n=1 Tax=Leptospira jelokensis TaxID=2484931 RepID=UPI001FCA2093|nr:MASE3 domain-containing protein [Leptospira jelokensis]